MTRSASSLSDRLRRSRTARSVALFGALLNRWTLLRPPISDQGTVITFIDALVQSRLACSKAGRAPLTRRCRSAPLRKDLTSTDERHTHESKLFKTTRWHERRSVTLCRVEERTMAGPGSPHPGKGY